MLLDIKDIFLDWKKRKNLESLSSLLYKFILDGGVKSRKMPNILSRVIYIIYLFCNYRNLFSNLNFNYLYYYLYYLINYLYIYYTRLQMLIYTNLMYLGRKRKKVEKKSESNMRRRQFSCRSSQVESSMA